jgi:hypothetical protein
MPRVCLICNHPKRIDIDRELVQGKSLQMIANTYNVDWQAVRRHKEGHLSRQLVQAYEKKSQEWAMDLLDHLRDLVFKAEAIFKRNYERDTVQSDIVALNALREQRGTFELLAKIIAYSQTKAIEQQAEERKAKDIDLSDFSSEELHVMLKLGLGPKNVDITPVQPIVTLPTRSSAPPPIIPAPESEPEIEPVPKRLPPRPTKIIPGFDSSCRPLAGWRKRL